MISAGPKAGSPEAKRSDSDTGGAPDTPIRYCTMEAPCGSLILFSSEEALTGLYPVGHPGVPELAGLKRDNAAFCGVRDQIEAYFRGRLETFTIPLSPKGTDFQKAVWGEVGKISWGQARTCQDIAEDLGKKQSAGVVATAVAKNPLSVVIPTHRVTGLAPSALQNPAVVALNRWLAGHEANVQPWRIASSRSSAAMRSPSAILGPPTPVRSDD